ncbi:MAG: hypothetical protein MUC87_02920 [Bacteroidia bacterium]|jgi:hypothetical protein|nr:hypothetical protein [Bacteroidia bacterium]
MKALHICFTETNQTTHPPDKKFKRSSAIPKLSASVINDVEAVYASHWESWSKGPLCFLEKGEIELVGLFFTEGTVEAAAIKSGLTENYAQQKLTRVLKRMYRYRSIVQDWLDCKTLKEKKQVLRRAPLTCIGLLSVRTRNAVSAIADNLDELWDWHLATDKSSRGIGAKALKEINDVFKYAGYKKTSYKNTINSLSKTYQ